MARDILVYHADGAGPILFEAFFATEGTVREWWSHPAQELGLPLLASIYEGGFSEEGVEFSGTQLDELASELDKLENHWMHSTTLDQRTQFVQRLSDFRTAIQVARSDSAVVSIS